MIKVWLKQVLFNENKWTNITISHFLPILCISKIILKKTTTINTIYYRSMDSFVW